MYLQETDRPEESLQHDHVHCHVVDWAQRNVESSSPMLESVITSKGQTTLPKIVREALALQPGDRVRYVIREGEVRILPVRPVNRLFGILRQDGPVATLEDMERAIAAGVCDT